MAEHKLMRLTRAVPNPQHDGRNKHGLSAIKSFPEGKLIHFWPTNDGACALLTVDDRVMPLDLREALLPAAEEVVAPASKAEVMAYRQLEGGSHDHEVLDELLRSGVLTLAQLDKACAAVAHQLELD